MNIRPNIVILTLFALFFVSLSSRAQEKQNNGGYLVPVCIYEGDTIPYVQLRTVYIFKTYEYLQTLPNEKARQRHIKKVEKGLKEQYTPRMKKLTFAQGKLLIKLVDRQSNQTSFELVKAFMGPFKAGFYQTFAALFGASLKKEYDPAGEDKLTERVVLLVENGQI